MGGKYNLKIQAQGKNHFVFLAYANVDVIAVETTFSTGAISRKDMSGYARKAAWGHVRRMLQRKAYQDELLKKEEVGQPISWGVEGPGLGSKEYWFVRGSQVYSREAAEIVEKYYDVCNATFISPDTWLDKKLQEAYTSPTVEEKRKSTDE